MSNPSIRSFVIPGLVGGLVLNLIDTPWSVIVMVPRLQAFSDAHQLIGHPLTGPWFLLLHFILGIATAWVYLLARSIYGSGVGTALLSGGVLLLLNRGFGIGNVLLGLMPLNLFLGLTVSFTVGMFAASIVIARMIERSNA